MLGTGAGIKTPTFALFPTKVACAGCFPLWLASLCKHQREREAGKKHRGLGKSLSQAASTGEQKG